MLSTSTLLDRDGITIRDVRCRPTIGRGQEIEASTERTLVFVRRGCFVRRARGDHSLLDPMAAYCANPGEDQSFDHPHAGGDDCTAIGFTATLCASIWGDGVLPDGPLRTSPQLDLEHRLLLAAARRGSDTHELAERAITIVAGALEEVNPRPVAAGRPATIRARRDVIDGAREILAAEPECPLPELARSLSVSPHHLSRIFRAATGHTVSRHRIRLRARAALEQLADGERDLARLAAELGFADQSHLYRVLRVETGCVPSALRRALTPS
jgi:AraC-like DNA-binding protein